MWLGSDAESVVDLITFLLAVHDIGKFAENFQHKAPDVVLQRFGNSLQRSHSSMHHDEVAAHFFCWMGESGNVPKQMRCWDEDVWLALLTASFGHHGTPPPSAGLGPGVAAAKLGAAMFEPSRAHALAFFAHCAARFLPADLGQCSESNAKLASWWIAGISVLADWIGSNTTWFQYATSSQREMPLERYWTEVALPCAERAIEEAGVIPEPCRRFAGAAALFPHLRGQPLRPAQELAETIELTEEPQVFFLEDATGSGKTEAALTLAARLIDAGLADGLFFGLPTQATADQLYERVSSNLPAWFDEPGKVCAVLAHGARDRAHPFKARLAAMRDAVPGELDSASMRVTQWLAQSNKRALQAQIGVGTIDQSLFAGLRVKHQSLRVLGLFRKVLLVDEVHSYDAYMTQALCQTLRIHASGGGSAILLSATMSLDLRTRLLNAYAEGIALSAHMPGRKRERSSTPGVAARSLEYPLLSRWSQALGTQPEEQEFQPAPFSRRTLTVDYLTREEEVLSRIGDWLDAEQSIVWVRNTVTDAVDAWRLLVERFGPQRIVLFHSRFAGIDRARVQTEVLRVLGKTSDASVRRGRVIVATQVLQESLDVDADQMVCDLSFVDVMLQRFGRYRRHLRDGHGSLLPADARPVDGRTPGPVVVFGPDRNEPPPADWYLRFSRGAAKVYRAHGKLWLSAKAIGDRIELPTQFRTLVEAVYGASAEEIPETLQTAEDRETGDAVAKRWAADANAIPIREGYRGEGWSDEERIGSRLGDSVEAVLLRADRPGLEPWAAGHCGEGDDPWALSEIRVPGYWLGEDRNARCADEALAVQVEALRAARPALKYRLLLPLTRDSSVDWRCDLAAHVQLTLSYNEMLGLRLHPPPSSKKGAA